MENEMDLMQKIKDSKNNNDVIALINDRFGQEQDDRERIHNTMVYEQIYNNKDFAKRLRWQIQELTNQTGRLSLSHLEAYIDKLRYIDKARAKGLNYWKIVDHDSLHAKIATPHDFKAVIDFLSKGGPDFMQIDQIQLKGNVKDKLDHGEPANAMDLINREFGRESFLDALNEHGFAEYEDAISDLVNTLYTEVGSWKDRLNTGFAYELLKIIDKIDHSKVTYWYLNDEYSRPITQADLFDIIDEL